MSSSKNYYEVLGVGKQATAEEIKKAFRKKARTAHPDAGGSEEEFKRINEAYEVLSDPEKRKQYDQFGQYAAGGFGQSGGYSAAGNPFAGSWKSTSGTSRSWTEIFESMMNGEGAFGTSWQMPNMNTPKKGADIAVPLEVSFQEAFTGTVKAVTIRIPSTGEKQTMKIKIPQGAADGSKLRYRGKGEFGSNGGERGDLVLTCKVKSDTLYSRRGSDVEMELPITLSEAMLGASVEVPAPDGTVVRMKVPPGTQSGSKLKIPGKGAKNAKGKGFGSLVLAVKVVLPQNLDSVQEQAVKTIESAYAGSVRKQIDKRVKAAR